MSHFFKSLVQSYVYLLCLDPARNGSRDILSGIQFTTHFIEIFVVETKRFVGTFVNVILTWQTCGQRSSRAAEGKRRALGNHFSERICYMFLRSKCRGEGDLGLCTTSGLAFGEPQRSGDKNVSRRRNIEFWLIFTIKDVLNPNFFFTIWVEPAQPQFLSLMGFFSFFKIFRDTKEFRHKRATAWLFHAGTGQNYCVTIHIAWSWSIHL